MFFKYTVPVPVASGKISRQKTKSGTYILYVISRQYDPAKKHTVPVRAMIGKVSDEEGMMFPNEKFFEYFPETPLPELRPEAERSCTLMAGTFIAIEEVVIQTVTKTTWSKIKRILNLIKNIKFCYNHPDPRIINYDYFYKENLCFRDLCLP